MPISFSAPRMDEEEVRREIQALPQEERNRAYQDLYGGLVTVEETPAMLDGAFMELHAAIQRIPMQESEAYREALRICPHYAGSNNFKLMFLRATNYDTQAAALRITAYWQEKVKLFGIDRAFRRLGLQDLTEAEHEIALRRGGIQALPGTDAAGRGIVFYDRTRWEARRSHRASMFRAHWYILHSLMEGNPVVQKNGLVMLVYTSPNAELESFDRKMIVTMMNHMRHVLPIRIVGFHHVINSSIIRLIMPLIYYVLGSEVRARYIQHIGMTGVQVMEALKQFGLVQEQVPIELGGQYQFDYETWIGIQQRIENNTTEIG